MSARSSQHSPSPFAVASHVLLRDATSQHSPSPFAVALHMLLRDGFTFTWSVNMNELLIISQREVPQLLAMSDCIELMDQALRQLARGHVVLPLRTVLRMPDGSGALASMPAILHEPSALGVKVITVFQGNHGTRFDSHQGAVLLFDTEHGSLVAIIDASAITAIRTAAVTAVATRALSRPDSAVLALIGSGVQAATHLEAIALVRPIREVRVWSRSPDHVQQFIERNAANGVSLIARASADQACRGADVICTLTSAREPVLHTDWIAPGTHINAVGSSIPQTREVDSATVARSRIFVDRRESALNEAGDLLIPFSEGAITPSDIAAELGEVLEGTSAGRRDASEITLFKSLGLAIEDVAAAAHIYRRAVDRGIGQRVPLGGARFE